MKNIKAEAESMLNEILGKKLKKEASSDFGSINFQKLSAAQVEQALENGGYSDNRIQKAKFKKMSNSQFVYSISYDTDDEEDSGEGEVHVYIDKDGSIKAEWGKRIYY